MGTSTGAECDHAVDYRADIAPLMERYCTSCHATSVPLERRRGAPGDHNFDAEPELVEFADHVALSAAGGPLAINRSMPPSGYSPQPSDAERALLGRWLACHTDGQDHSLHVH